MTRPLTHSDRTLSKDEMVKRLDDDGTYLLNGDGWEPDEELTRQEAEQAVIDFCRGKLEQDKIRVASEDGDCAIKIEVTFSVHTYSRLVRPNCDRCGTNLGGGDCPKCA